MKAIVFEQAGQAEDVLSVQDIPPVAPGPGQVQIKVLARPIQPADFLFIGGRYRIKPVFPQPAGLEGVGTVAACGTGVTNIKEGERVAFRAPGAWAEFVVAPVSRVYTVPPDVPDDIASQFALNPLTAWGLLSECNLQPPSRILVTAGRSIVARLLARLGQNKGFETVLLVRDKGGYAALDGNTGQIIAGRATVTDTLNDIAGAGLFHAALDAVGGSDSLALMDSLQPRGRLISYGILNDDDITLKASRILYKNMIWQGFGIDGWLDSTSQEQLNTAQNELWSLLSSYPYLLPVIERFDLPRIHDAIRASREPHGPGKILLVG